MTTVKQSAPLHWITGSYRYIGQGFRLDVSHCTIGLEPQEQIILRDMNEQEKRLVYDLVAYIASRKE